MTSVVAGSATSPLRNSRNFASVSSITQIVSSTTTHAAVSSLGSGAIGKPRSAKNRFERSRSVTGRLT